MILGSLTRHSLSVSSMRSVLEMVLQAKNLLEIGQKQRVMIPNLPLPISSRIWYWLFTIMSAIAEEWFLLVPWEIGGFWFLLSTKFSKVYLSLSGVVIGSRRAFGGSSWEMGDFYRGLGEYGILISNILCFGILFYFSFGGVYLGITVTCFDGLCLGFKGFRVLYCCIDFTPPFWLQEFVNLTIQIYIYQLLHNCFGLITSSQYLFFVLSLLFFFFSSF